MNDSQKLAELTQKHRPANHYEWEAKVGPEYRAFQGREEAVPAPRKKGLQV